MKAFQYPTHWFRSDLPEGFNPIYTRNHLLPESLSSCFPPKVHKFQKVGGEGVPLSQTPFRQVFPPWFFYSQL